MLPTEQFWNDLLIFFANITSFAMVIPVVTSLIFRRYWNKPLRIVSFYFLIILLLNLFEGIFIWLCFEYKEIIAPFRDYWEIDNTIFLQIFFYLNNFIFLSIFYSIIFPSKGVSKIIFYLGYCLGVIAIFNYFFVIGYKRLGVLNPSINALFIFSIPLVYLWYSQLHSLRIPLKKNPYFWITLGLVLPNLIGLFLNFSGDFLYIKDYSIYTQIHSIKNIFATIGQILISIGFAHSYYARFIKIAD